MLVMLLCGIVVIRLALSPVAVISSTCTEDHPYYLANCEGPTSTPTSVTLYPTASESDMPDTEPPIYVPVANATQVVQSTAVTQSTPEPEVVSSIIPLANDATTATVVATRTPTIRIIPTVVVIQTPTLGDQVIDKTTSSFECQRESQVTIRGSTSPYSLLLISFDKRVVGGGMSDESGDYVIPLSTGLESSGTHTIQIIQRSTSKVIRTLRCTVP